MRMARSRRGGIEEGDAGLEDEKCGTNEDANQDEEESLLLEKVIEGSGERSGVLEGFGRIRGTLSTGHLLISPVICA